MAEYIEREELRKTLETWRDAHADVDDEDGWGLLEDVLRELNAQATADVAPVVHGRWEWLGPNGLVTECMCGTCSACKVRSKYIVNTMLCPNCGAKMDGGGDE